MARKLTKAQSGALFSLFLILAVIGGIIHVVETLGPWNLLFGVVFIAGLGIWLQKKKRAERMAFLMSKYNDEQLVSRIMSGFFWEGQTSEQLIDSIGLPVEKDEKKLKTKQKEIWKYNSQGGNRFGLRITLEDGVVVGWEKKAA